MNKAYNLLQSKPTGWFAITLTISDYHSRDMSLKSLFEYSLVSLAKRLNRFSIRWDAYPELQPSSLLLHWHLAVRTTDKYRLARFLNFWGRHFGFFLIKPVINDSIKLEGWLRYCEKDWHEMQQVLNLQRKMMDPTDHPTNKSYKRYLMCNDSEVLQQMKFENDMRGPEI